MKKPYIISIRVSTGTIFAKVCKTLQVRAEANAHLTRAPLRVIQRPNPRARAVKVGQDMEKHGGLSSRINGVWKVVKGN